MFSDFRNAKYLANGRISCEINHAQYGWIPATIDPDERPDEFALVAAGDVADHAPPVVDLAEVQAAAMWRVNSAIGDVRAQFITQITGQEIVYQHKEAEAEAYLSDPSPDISNYPFIAAEVGLTGDTAADVAETYARMAGDWRTIGSALERIRIGALNAIEAAPDTEAVESAEAVFSESLAALLAAQE